MGSLSFNDIYKKYMNDTLNQFAYGQLGAYTNSTASAGSTNYTTIKYDLSTIAPAPTKSQPKITLKSSPNLDWLDERVNEMRVKL